jgi:hypothetical protein
VVESFCNSSRSTSNSRTACHDVKGERRDVGVEEAIETAADAVVVQRGQLSRRQPELFGGVPCGPLADAVEGLARQEDVLDQDEQTGRGGDTRPAVLRREVAVEELVEAEPPEEAVEDRQGGDAPGGQGAPGGVGSPSGMSW